MAVLTINGKQCYYETEGDGFPLLLVPEPQGVIADWHGIMPLLGELCKAIGAEYRGIEQTEPTTEPTSSDSLAANLATLLDALGLERVYLAATRVAGQEALSLALHAPERLEGLILIGMYGDNAAPEPPSRHVSGIAEMTDEAAFEARWQEITVPTLLLVGDQAHQHLQRSELLAARMPHCRRVVIPGAGYSPHLEQPRRLGHAMMDFLIQRERQRNLVRGASFLL